ncbi:hypothetical protein [Streptomyces sp. PSKA30]|uniref:hypothetical protein n=1 Tax=Streptomyces sp. PSKA30 TaxID=2874597 RepID=UPI0035B147B8
MCVAAQRGDPLLQADEAEPAPARRVREPAAAPAVIRDRNRVEPAVVSAMGQMLSARQP